MRSGSNQRPPGRQNNNRPFRPPQPHRAGGGPNPQSRGNAHQAFERYVALAREATIEGDRVAAENFYQHAEHYFRTANANRDPDQQGKERSTTPAGSDRNSLPNENSLAESDREPPNYSQP